MKQFFSPPNIVMAQQILVVEDMENVRFGCNFGKPIDQPEEDAIFSWPEMEGSVTGMTKDWADKMEDSAVAKLEKS